MRIIIELEERRVPSIRMEEQERPAAPASPDASEAYDGGAVPQSLLQLAAEQRGEVHVGPQPERDGGGTRIRWPQGLGPFGGTGGEFEGSTEDAGAAPPEF